MIIDFHSHVFPTFFRDRNTFDFSDEPAFEDLYGSKNAKIVGIEDLLRNMDEEGIEKSVIFGFPWNKKKHYRKHNDYILEAVHRFPERLIGFCSFSPQASGIVREAERCLEAGLSGLGELALYHSDFSQKIINSLEDVMSLCLQFDVPLMFHTNEPVGHNYPGKAPMSLRQIYLLLKAYPKVKIVLAHWGGGLFFYSLMKKEVKEVLRNVWFDTAASPFLYEPNIYKVAGESIGFDKILFGSDYPLIKPERYFREMAITEVSISALEKIKGGNAARLLNLTR